jgi:hypothetical protein
MGARASAILLAVVVPLACARRPPPVAPAQPAAAAAPYGAPAAPYAGATPSAMPAAPGTASAAPSASAANPCAGPTECAPCTQQPGCRFCTGPRTCITAAAAQLPGACGTEGLSLGDPASCGSDPVVAARNRARDVEDRRRAALDSTAGMRLSGASMDARLEHFSSLEIPVPAGTCHVVLWKLAPDAKPGDVRISLDFETPRSSQGGLTGFDTESRVGSTGVECSSLAGRVRFRLVDRWSYGPVASGGTGGISFELYTRLRAPTDPDDVGAGASGSAPRSGGSVGVDCLDCTFPCESSKRACERDCFRSGAEEWQKTICNNTCDQIYRSCLRGCPGCD